jgi:hypothetical protein
MLGKKDEGLEPNTVNILKQVSEMWPVLPLYTANYAPWHDFEQYVSHFLLLFLTE